MWSVNLFMEVFVKVCSEINSHVITALWISYDLWFIINLWSWKILYDYFIVYVIYSAIHLLAKRKYLLPECSSRWDVAEVRSQRDMFGKLPFFVVLHILYNSEKQKSVLVCVTFKNWRCPIRGSGRGCAGCAEHPLWMRSWSRELLMLHHITDNCAR